MSGKPRFPLLAKVAAWLLLHLLVLAAAFAVFVNWQLQLGLESLLSGATGERLESLGTEIASELSEAKESEWDAIIAARISQFQLKAILREPDQLGPDIKEHGIPDPIMELVKKSRPPGRDMPRERRHEGPPDGFPPPRDGSEPPPGRGGPPPERPSVNRSTTALFLAKNHDDGNYWAALELQIPEQRRPRSAILFLVSETASANGLFFDYRPWLFGGLAVLALSILFWTPFVLGITHYAGRISKATARIADGNFDTEIGISRNDELGKAGESIEQMSARIGSLISGQRRFLGDVAHELCAPLARMRTGLGILANSADEKSSARIASIDEDAEELSTLVSELLAFTKANSTKANPESINLNDLLDELVTRELPEHSVNSDIPADLSVKADRRLLTRALLNILRNCHRHAGPASTIFISTVRHDESVSFTIEDNGPGVPPESLPKLFEPFYRPDTSRTRETGGTGLGMAIVDSSIRASGGMATARKSKHGGLLVELKLPLA